MSAYRKSGHISFNMKKVVPPLSVSKCIGIFGLLLLLLLFICLFSLPSSFLLPLTGELRRNSTLLPRITTLGNSQCQVGKRNMTQEENRGVYAVYAIQIGNKCLT